jgi:hypothetical protein
MGAGVQEELPAATSPLDEVRKARGAATAWNEALAVSRSFTRHHWHGRMLLTLTFLL